MSVPENKPAEVPEDKLVEALAEKVRDLLRAHWRRAGAAPGLSLRG